MYKNKINKCLNNTQKVYSTISENRSSSVSEDRKMDRSVRYDNVSVDKKISDIFNANDYVYKADVKIVTDSGTLNKRVVARNRNNLITMDGEYIPISIIRDIYK